MSIHIDRCLCFKQSFAELKQLAEQHHCTTLAELRQWAIFGQKCQLCVPYIQRMLQTGETIFHDIITASAPCELQYEYEKNTEKHPGGYDPRRNSNPHGRNG